jgi:hypothetical protein
MTAGSGLIMGDIAKPITSANKTLSRIGIERNANIGADRSKPKMRNETSMITATN